jgi:acyl carrier protein
MKDPTAEVLAALARITPESDLSQIDPNAPLTDQLDIDSMDFLNFIAALSTRWGVDIPEADYPALATIEGATTYLRQHGPVA